MPPLLPIVKVAVWSLPVRLGVSTAISILVVVPGARVPVVPEKEISVLLLPGARVQIRGALPVFWISNCWVLEFGKKVIVVRGTARTPFNSIVGEGVAATVVGSSTVVVGVMTGDPVGNKEVPVMVGVAAMVVGIAVVGGTVGVFLTAGRGV